MAKNTDKIGRSKKSKKASEEGSELSIISPTAYLSVEFRDSANGGVFGYSDESILPGNSPTEANVAGSWFLASGAK